MKIQKLFTILLVICLCLAMTTTVCAAPTAKTLSDAADKTSSYLLKSSPKPTINAVGGEWTIISLARSEYAVPKDYFSAYYQRVESLVQENNGVLHQQKYTEYSRVVIALTAAGYDPQQVGGYDLTAPLGDYEQVVWQGVNGLIWALIALDSGNYQLSSLRWEYVNALLDRQLPDGGWSLSGNTGDPDITGMALIALAKYAAEPKVNEAAQKAFTFLSQAQGSDGGYGYGSDPSAESVVQVIVALCAWSIDLNDERFVKNGVTLLDNLLSYQNQDGSFRHTLGGSGETLMSSEQALCALTAAIRAAKDEHSLYDMRDVTLIVADNSSANKNTIGVQDSSQYTTFPDIAGHPHQAAIEALASRGIVDGVSLDAFAPNEQLNRAQFTAIAVRGLGLSPQQTSAFEDVAPEAWYNEFIGAAFANGIIYGTQTGTFNPNGILTNQEAAVMTARAANIAGLDTSLSETARQNILAQFGDYRTVAPWATEALAYCYANNLLDDSALDIKPQDPITRGAMAELFYRMLGKAGLFE